MTYSVSFIFDFYVEAENAGEAKAKIKMIAEQLENLSGIDPMSELGQITKPDVSSMSYIP